MFIQAMNLVEVDIKVKPSPVYNEELRLIRGVLLAADYSGAFTLNKI